MMVCSLFFNTVYTISTIFSFSFLDSTIFVVFNEFIVLSDSSGQDSGQDEDLWIWRNKQIDLVSSSDENFNVTIFLMVCLSLLVLYFCIRWYRYKPKAKRRKSHMKRLVSMLQCRRIPAV